MVRAWKSPPYKKKTRHREDAGLLSSDFLAVALAHAAGYEDLDLREDKEQPRPGSRFCCGSVRVPRNLVVLLRSAFTWSVIAERVHLLANRIDRHLIRQPGKLDAEPSRRNKRLNQFVVSVAVSLQSWVFKVERKMPLIGGSPLIEAVAHRARGIRLFAQFEFIGALRNIAVLIRLTCLSVRSRAQVPTDFPFDRCCRVIVIKRLNIGDFLEVSRASDRLWNLAIGWLRSIDCCESHFRWLDRRRFA